MWVIATFQGVEKMHNNLNFFDRSFFTQNILELFPSGAIKAPYVIDAGKCISCLTIEHKGSILEELRPTMGWRIFGCDVCQEVCPWNRKGQMFLSNVQRPVRDNSMVSDLIHLFQMSDEMFEKEFKGTALWRPGRVRLQRNIAIALGNLKCEKSVPFLEKALEYPEALIREYALWALRHIRSVI